MWIVVEGGAIELCLFVQQGGFDAHARLQNKDLPARIRYTSILESSDQITWILDWVKKKGEIFVSSLCMYFESP